MARAIGGSYDGPAVVGRLVPNSPLMSDARVAASIGRDGPFDLAPLAGLGTSPAAVTAAPALHRSPAAR